MISTATSTSAHPSNQVGEGRVGGSRANDWRLGSAGWTPRRKYLDEDRAALRLCLRKRSLVEIVKFRGCGDAAERPDGGNKDQYSANKGHEHLPRPSKAPWEVRIGLGYCYLASAERSLAVW